MIYVISDTHGDKSRLKRSALGKIGKDDFLIICGDFGFIWNGGAKEKRYLKRLGRRKYNILFLDGAHENFTELEKYGTETWNGGLVRRISGNLRQLTRGEVFTLGGKKIFAFGGGQPMDTDLLPEGYFSSRAPELPTEEDMRRGAERLKEHGNKVDFIFSHEAPGKISDFLKLAAKSRSNTLFNSYLDNISETCDFGRWYFGQRHINKTISSKYIAVYNKTVTAE